MLDAPASGVWASTGDAAAGYEPRNAAGDAAGDAAFEAGVPWLLRLRSLRLRGFSAPDALAALLGERDESPNGSTVEPTLHEAASLDALEEWSGKI
ncbi:hypothetical protein [Streptomyces sp. NPDC001546]|uniref:hypothetical protein n=1 Tax=Streptomyces sp. NPDC001546 TaxID=3364585 RepID=UPI00369D19B1